MAHAVVKRRSQTAVAEWLRLGPSEIWAPARDDIIWMRRLLLVHSHIYYRLDDSLVSDHKWQEWADYLARLQCFYGWEAGFYDQAFEDWDGSTGFHLPTDLFIADRARRLLEYRDQQQQRKLFA